MSRYAAYAVVVASAVACATATRSPEVLSTESHRTPASADTGGTPIAMSPLYKSSDGGALGAMRSVVTTREEFERVWQVAHSTHLTNKPPLPQVDFSRQAVVVAAMGFQGGAGTEIRITRAVQRGSVLEIFVELRLLSERCSSYSGIQYPTEMVRVPATRSTPVFHDTITRVDC